jgi:threonine dehydrogenase-like Zn-dependent dehydrogenase
VSFIAPDLSGRWNKDRRYAATWEALRGIGPSRWISHRFPIERAGEAYRLIDEDPGSCIQVVFGYGQPAQAPGRHGS